MDFRAKSTNFMLFNFAFKKDTRTVIVRCCMKQVFSSIISPNKINIVIKMKLLLQHRILLEYIIHIVDMLLMAAIMFYERNRVQNIEMFISVIRNVEQITSTVYNHRNLLTVFHADFPPTKSETVIPRLL